MANDTTNKQGLGSGAVYENIDTAKTLTAADNGVVQNVIADAITITLPATGAGLYRFVIRNGGVPASSSVGAGTGSDASALVTVAPNASDKITGLNIATPTDNKAILNTKATAKVGDYIVLSPDAGDGWIVTEARGIWVSA